MHSASYFSSVYIEILDYRVNNSPLEFVAAGGNQTQCAYVQLIDDEIDEPTEYFTIVLTSQDRAVIVTNPSATITIQDQQP